MVIVPNEAELRERRRLRHEHFVKLTEGKSVRFKRRMERVERTESATAFLGVRVLPKDDEMRKVLVHPGNNAAFPEHGSVEWPLDQFTLRRLRDGDVTLDASHPQQFRQAPTVRHAGGARAPEYQRRSRPQPPPVPPRSDEPKTS